MNLEEFRNLAQGIQAIFVSLAAIIASGWAVYTFHTLLSTKKAKAELDKLDSEIRKSHLELEKIEDELKRKPLLSVKVEPYKLSNISGINCIHAKVILENIGNTAEYIEWSKSSFTAAIVEELDGAKIRYSEPIPGILVSIEPNSIGVSLWQKETFKKEIIIPIERNGTYLIEAKVQVSADSSEMLNLGNKTSTTTSFNVTSFFEVEKLPLKQNA